MYSIDLLLVNPNDKRKHYGELSTSFTAIEPPLFSALLAAYIRKHSFTVKILDAEAEGLDPRGTAEQIVRYKPRVVGIGALGANPSAASTPKMSAIRGILEELDNAHSDLIRVLYGIHPSALPERTLNEENVDYVCKGECFTSMVELLAVVCNNGKNRDVDIPGIWYKRDNEIISNGWGSVIANLVDLPSPAWDLVPMEKYRAHNWHCFHALDKRQPYGVVFTSLGCPFHCQYCNIHSLYEGKPGIRYRPLEAVIKDIDFLVNEFNVRNIKIVDELFTLNKERVINLCNMLIDCKYDLNIWAYARVDTVNKNLLERMKKAGIQWLCYGIETASTKVREDVTKGQFSKKEICDAISMTHAAGIHVIGNYLFGLPEDTLETMEETLSLAKELKCEYANFYTTMAYPGSELYQSAILRKVALPDSWSAYSQLSKDAVPLPTKYVSAADVLRFRDNAFFDYYSDTEYQLMIENTFGNDAVEHIRHMLTHKIERELLKKGDAL
ncbi:B12-binding domain-containing radical SAM protein [Candidatus Omnitrophota bacterium]